MSAIRVRKRLLQLWSFFVLASLALTALSETSSDRESCCVMDRDLRKLEESKNLVEEQAPLVIGGGIVRPKERHICV